MRTTIGVLHVRRSILIGSSPTRVWREFESTERIKKWLEGGHTIHAFEPTVGGQVLMSVEINGEHRPFGGEVLVCEPGCELTFECQWRGTHAWTVPTYWTFRLTPHEGGTHVELLHHGFERLGAAAPDNLEGYEEGWTVRHLKALRAVIGRDG